MVILTPIERETLQDFFLHISQMLNVSTFGNTADIYAIVHLVPHASACGTRWTIAQMSAVLPKVDTLSICEICKKNLESFSLYRRKNYHDLLRSLFVAHF